MYLLPISFLQPTVYYSDTRKKVMIITFKAAQHLFYCKLH